MEIFINSQKESLTFGAFPGVEREIKELINNNGGYCRNREKGALYDYVLSNKKPRGNNDDIYSPDWVKECVKRKKFFKPSNRYLVLSAFNSSSRLSDNSKPNPGRESKHEPELERKSELKRKPKPKSNLNPKKSRVNWTSILDGVVSRSISNESNKNENKKSDRSQNEQSRDIPGVETSESDFVKDSSGPSTVSSDFVKSSKSSYSSNIDSLPSLFESNEDIAESNEDIAESNEDSPKNKKNVALLESSDLDEPKPNSTTYPRQSPRVRVTRSHTAQQSPSIKRIIQSQSSPLRSIPRNEDSPSPSKLFNQENQESEPNPSPPKELFISAANVEAPSLLRHRNTFRVKKFLMSDSLETRENIEEYAALVRKLFQSRYSLLDPQVLGRTLAMTSGEFETACELIDSDFAASVMEKECVFTQSDDEELLNGDYSLLAERKGKGFGRIKERLAFLGYVIDEPEKTKLFYQQDQQDEY